MKDVVLLILILYMRKLRLRALRLVVQVQSPIMEYPAFPGAQVHRDMCSRVLQ